MYPERLTNITPSQNVAHLEAHDIVGFASEFLQVLVSEEAVHVHLSRRAGTQPTVGC